jgi:small subunit ribosomal protein S7
MSRRHSAEKRQILPDPEFGDLTLSKFINNLMYDGKKSIAETIVYEALKIVEKRAGNDNRVEEDGKVKNRGLKLFHEALDRVRPHVEVRSRRVGGATYQVPMEVRSERGFALAMRWLIGAARKRSERTMTERLAAEIENAAKGQGNAVKKKEDTHKMADANKAFAHFRW